MAKPFIFGYHRRQFRLFRTNDGSSHPAALGAQASRPAPREGFFVGSRRSEGAIYGSRLSDNEEPAEKIRDRAISHESL